MKENKARVNDRRTGFVCSELPFMATTGLTVAQERRHIQDRRADRIEYGNFKVKEKD